MFMRTNTTKPWWINAAGVSYEPNRKGIIMFQKVQERQNKRENVTMTKRGPSMYSVEDAIVWTSWWRDNRDELGKLRKVCKNLLPQHRIRYCCRLSLRNGRREGVWWCCMDGVGLLQWGDCGAISKRDNFLCWLSVVLWRALFWFLIDTIMHVYFSTPGYIHMLY